MIQPNTSGKSIEMKTFVGASWADLPNDHRPNSIDDLTYFHRNPVEVLRVDSDAMANKAVVELWETIAEHAAHHPDLEIDGLAIRAKNTPEEIHRKIGMAAMEYDRAKERFLDLMNGKSDRYFHWGAVDDYAATEGIEFDAELAEELTIDD